MLKTKVTPYVVPTESHYDYASVRKCIIAQLRNGTESQNTDTSKFSAIIVLFFFVCQVKKIIMITEPLLKHWNLFSCNILFVGKFLFGKIITVFGMKHLLIYTHDPHLFSPLNWGFIFFCFVPIPRAYPAVIAPSSEI